MDQVTFAYRDQTCFSICQVLKEVLKTEVEHQGFKLFQRDQATVNALENHVLSLLLHKDILLIVCCKSFYAVMLLMNQFML